MPTPSALRGRALLATLYDAAVVGAAPGPLTTAALRSHPTLPDSPVRIFALGKGAHAMSAAAVEALHDAGCVIAGGVIVAPDVATSPHAALAALAGDHPVPGARSFAAAASIADGVAGVRQDDTVLVLLSGGASSLIAAPLPGLSEGDVARLFELLHRAGLDIRAMNVIRKRFTRWGAGRLAVALASARTHVLALSDVPGDDPADIASGPCAPDTSRAHDVLALLRDAQLLAALPPTLLQHLEHAERGDIDETPKPHHPAFASVTTHVIGSSGLAVAAAIERARELGIFAEAGTHPLGGEAAACGTNIADLLLARAARGLAGCVVWGGETTVLRGSLAPPASADVRPGAGGRCQELALSAARRLAAGGDAARRISILAAGTDGRDGPTDAAGGFADDTVWNAIMQHGHHPQQALDRHESYAALGAANALFQPGPTGTNVMDIVIGLIE